MPQVPGPPSAGLSGPPNGHGPAGARRGPTRAEDILEAAARGGTPAPPSGSGTRWWSKGGGPARPSAAPVAVPREPVTAGTSEAGLPIRRPMAQLPLEQAAAVPVPAAPPAAVPFGEPDPDQVSKMLSRFYSGVHRAGSEDDNPTVPINDPRSTA